MAKRTRYEEYLICKERGHKASIRSSALLTEPLLGAPPWSVCVYCGVMFRFENNLIEKYAPMPEADAEGELIRLKDGANCRDE